MQYKALRNFSCNNVDKKIGELLSQEEVAKMGKDYIAHHLLNDLIQAVAPEAAPELPTKEVSKSPAPALSNERASKGIQERSK